MKPVSCYAFGPFVLDRQRGLLLEHGQPVVLTPRAFELLAALVEHAGELLAKDDLIRLVWGGTIVEENNLARQISTLRKALREHPGQHEYIVTIPSVGYRFVAPVSEVSTPLPTAALPMPVATAPAPPAPLPSRRTWWFAAVTALVLASIVIAVLLVQRFMDTAGAPAPQRSLRQFTFGSGLQSDPTWSPDGRRLAFASDRLGNSDIWIQQMSDAEPIRLTSSPARDWQPDWAPDGKSIVYRSEEEGGGLYIVAAEGGSPRRLADFGTRPRWSPSGHQILFTNATVRTGARRLFVVDAVGGTPREIGADVIAPLIKESWLASIDAAWHPDGRRVSMWGQLPEGRWVFATVPLSGGVPTYASLPDADLRALDEQRVRLGRFVWAPSGKFLYFEGQIAETRNVWRVSVDADALDWLGGPERLTTDIAEDADIALSPDGKRLAFTVRSPRTSVWAMDFDPRLGRLTGQAQAVTPSSTGQLDVDTPRDGSRLAYRSIRGGRSEVREVSTASHEERVLLVSSEWSLSSPRWSSDGRRLAYSRPAGASTSVLRGSSSLVAVLSTDQRREQLLTIPKTATFRPSDWSSDGTTILGDCRPAAGESIGICLIPVSETIDKVPNLRVLVHDPARNLYGPRFSPDQHWVSFVAVDKTGATKSQIYVAPVSGGAWIPITDGRSFDDKPRWAPDGTAVYFVSDQGGYLNLRGRKFDPATGRPRGESTAVTSFDSPARGLPSNPSQIEFGISERRLFIPITETDGSVWVLDDVDR